MTALDPDDRSEGRTIPRVERADPSPAFLSGSKRIAIVRVAPAGYPHHHAFDEVVQALTSALVERGIEVTLLDNSLASDAINIVIGAHLLGDAALRSLPNNVILYNFEQFDKDSKWMSGGYVAALAANRCWDYSQRNLLELHRRYPHAPAEFVPLAYSSVLTRLPRIDQDIDVLFYGTVSPRRLAVLDALARAGAKVFVGRRQHGNRIDAAGDEINPAIYGGERDALIQRAKIVLNIHHYESQILEVVRLSYLMSNSKAIVSECGPNTEVYPHLRDGLCLVGYDQLVGTCLHLLQDPVERGSLEQRALRAVRRVRYADVLAPIIGRQFHRPAGQAKVAVPKRINLGSGKDWRQDMFNLDVVDRVQPDWNVDICQPLPIGEVIQTERFADFILQPETFSVIMANDVLEHLPDLVQAMTNCLLLLEEGGEMHIQVPYDLSYGAWQDPTHVRAFNERSWLYYTDWHWYLGWKQARFFVQSEEFLLSPLGFELARNNVPDEEIRRTPRAVDAMRVVLRKAKLGGAGVAPVGRP